MSGIEKLAATMLRNDSDARTPYLICTYVYECHIFPEYVCIGWFTCGEFDCQPSFVCEEGLNDCINFECSGQYNQC